MNETNAQQFIDYVNGPTLILILSFLLGLTMGSLITLVIVLRQMRRALANAVASIQEMFRTSVSSVSRDLVQQITRQTPFQPVFDATKREPRTVGFQPSKEEIR